MTQDAEMNGNMDILYDSLLDILKREVEVYREIHGVILDEKMILMKPTLDKINENNARKETWILKARLLEEVRENLVRKIAAGLGLPADDVTLSLLVSCAGGIQGGELADCQSTLSSLLHSIRDANNGNRALIDASLQFFGNSISFISELMSPRTGYLDTGKIKTVNRNGKILSVEG